MGYKMQESLKRNKKNFIIYAILWLIIAIVFVSPAAYSSYLSMQDGAFNFEEFIGEFGNLIADPFGTLGKSLSAECIGMFWNWLWKYTIAYFVIAIIGIIRTAPKHEYDKIEHGSSDWAANGEQYKVLNKKKGIILAEDNYLPLDKRGNVNVLVVGRFRFW
ncbi:MAG: hypothetical protein IKT41_02990 [Clostridia bacterium]|nr:hypothetical protein [Clostridia bacterium]